MKQGEIVVIVDCQGNIVREFPFDAARWPHRAGKPVFGPRARRLRTAKEVMALDAFKAYCAAQGKEATERQAAKWRAANRALCLGPPGPAAVTAAA
jgi:hypothetical protein